MSAWVPLSPVRQPLALARQSRHKLCLRTDLARLERYGRIVGEKAQLRLNDTRDGLRSTYDHRRREPPLRAIGAAL